MNMSHSPPMSPPTKISSVIAQRPLDSQCGMNCAPRRILVCDGCAQQRHQPITALLIDSALEAMNLGGNQLESAPHDFAEILRIELLTNPKFLKQESISVRIPWGIAKEQLCLLATFDN